MNKYVVLGTGPSSFACIAALVEKKIKPLVLDVKYKNNKQYKILLKENNFNRKLTGIQNYYGKGGLLNLWGGAINKVYKKQNLKNYEFKIEKAFDNILKYIYQAGDTDKYSNAFNLKKPNFKIKTTNNLSYHKNNKNYFFGYSRTAMMKNYKIFNTSHFINKLIQKKKIIYKNFIVEKINEKKEFIIIEDKERNKIFCKKLFVGLGALNTSKLLIKSKIVKKINLKETRLVYSLWLSKKKLNFKENKLHADLFFSSITDKFHNQIYFFKLNTFKKIAETFPISNFIPGFIKKIIAGRFVIFFTYLDQSISRVLTVKLKKNQININVNQKNNKFKFKLKKMIDIIKLSFPKIICVKIFKHFKFGFGNHYGSSFPLGLKKNGSDIFGRIKNLKNIHIIDASVLPTIEANCITLNIMAFSRFITTNCLNEDFKKKLFKY